MLRSLTITTALVAALGAVQLTASCSTDDICDEACEIWDSCTQVEGNTVNYPYDECHAECKDDGDWSRAYVRCLRKQSNCPQLGNNCG
jgi:hypothetical protein